MVRRTGELSSLLLVVRSGSLASLQTIEGCVEEVLTSFLSNKVGLIGPKFCQAITKISENCWPKIFPLNPLFPPLLKDYCARLATPGPTQRISSRKITITTN
ncbi:hypothetical protein HHK36_021358 [Tetracentron sinense]|uniref:Prolamin-like domain-containing protein n=1 Tax=Tetracentron sinense TaxID=13715 RepID=A0A834YRC9_TETSI|nr:hypothetical protein HHK36_021358 [Tetracentron sinense]